MGIEKWNSFRSHKHTKNVQQHEQFTATFVVGAGNQVKKKTTIIGAFSTIEPLLGQWKVHFSRLHA